MMAHHYKALTYEPKIPGVRDGSIRQTIRPKPKVEVTVGDTITWHGWEGRPYRSPWSWRKDVVVTEVIPIMVSEGGYLWRPLDVAGHMPHAWDGAHTNTLAALDGIDPPTGLALRDALKGKNGKGWEGEYIVIQW